MITGRKRQREELLLCMIEQDYFVLDAYTEEMEKLDGTTLWGLILRENIIQIIRDVLDEIIDSSSNEKENKK